WRRPSWTSVTAPCQPACRRRGRLVARTVNPAWSACRDTRRPSTSGDQRSAAEGSRSSPFDVRVAVIADFPSSTLWAALLPSAFGPADGLAAEPFVASVHGLGPTLD